MTWEEWISAEVRAAYFADLGGAYRTRQRWATFTVLILTSGAATAFVAELSWLPPWIPAILSLLATGCSAYLVVAQNLQHAIECSDLHYRWARLAAKYHNIWNNMYADDASARLTATIERALETSKSGTSIPNDKKRLTRWFDLTVQNRTPRAA